MKHSYYTAYKEKNITLVSTHNYGYPFSYTKTVFDRKDLSKCAIKDNPIPVSFVVVIADILQ